MAGSGFGATVAPMPGWVIAAKEVNASESGSDEPLPVDVGIVVIARRISFN